MHTNLKFRTYLLIFIAAMFLTDIVLMISGVTGISESYHQRAINVAFRSAFGVFELIMIGIMIYFIKKYPARRVRLFSLLFFHVIGVLVIPMGTRNYSLMALSFPWPQTLLPFDRATSHPVFIASLVIGFFVIPLITVLWGRKAFCGYICPLGGFYSECLGRLFNPKPERLKWLRKYGPPSVYLMMVTALATLLLFPHMLDSLRAAHKLFFFATSQVLYFVVGIPLIGARSYCTHVCPLGFEIGWIVKGKNRLKNSGR